MARQRLASNRNLSYYNHSAYNGYSLMPGKGEFIQEYLEKGFKVFMHAIHQHPRTAMFRFDLRFPVDYPYSFDNRVISSFTDGLRKAIQRDNQSKIWNTKHETQVNFLWVKEYGRESNRPHYHFVLFLNKDVYASLGLFTDPRSLYALIERQWLNAIKQKDLGGRGLVHASNNKVHFQTPVQYMDRNSSDWNQQYQDAFMRLSYLFKAETKVFEDGLRNIGTSQLM